MAAAKIPLRERKFAKTKLSLLNTAVASMEDKSLDEISVKELCEGATVSEATFFNYFGKKQDLLDYYIQLWMIELGWHSQQTESKGLAAIWAIFEHVAKEFQQRPGLMGEVIAHQARKREKGGEINIGRAERLLAFPKLEGIEHVPASGLDRIWLASLQHAVDSGELPANTHLPVVLVGLASIFYGVPLILHATNPSAIPSTYRQQLNIFWAGIKGTAEGNAG